MEGFQGVVPIVPSRSAIAIRTTTSSTSDCITHSHFLHNGIASQTDPTKWPTSVSEPTSTLTFEVCILSQSHLFTPLPIQVFLYPSLHPTTAVQSK